MSTMKLYFINLYFHDNMGYASRTARFEREKGKNTIGKHIDATRSYLKNNEADIRENSLVVKGFNCTAA